MTNFDQRNSRNETLIESIDVDTSSKSQTNNKNRNKALGLAFGTVLAGGIVLPANAQNYEYYEIKPCPRPSSIQEHESRRRNHDYYQQEQERQENMRRYNERNTERVRRHNERAQEIRDQREREQREQYRRERGYANSEYNHPYRNNNRDTFIKVKDKNGNIIILKRRQD